MFHPVLARDDMRIHTFTPTRGGVGANCLCLAAVVLAVWVPDVVEIRCPPEAGKQPADGQPFEGAHFGAEAAVRRAGTPFRLPKKTLSHQQREAARDLLSKGWGQRQVEGGLGVNRTPRARRRVVQHVTAGEGT